VDAEKAVLGQLTRQREDLNAALNLLLSRERRGRIDYEIRCREGTTAGSAGMLRSGLDALNEMIERQQESIRSVEKEINRQIEKILLLSKEKSSMEKLKQKQLALYEYAEAKEIERFIEDFVQNRAYSDNSF
jgi:flagellar export protein FliJ